ncbi:MAG TPA: heparinase II/III family protein, partial [Terriglobales bacterium]
DSSGDYTSFSGEHDGYRRLGVTHRRTVHWLRDAGWVIVDDLLGSGNHELRLHWLAPDLPCEVSDSPFQVQFKTTNQQQIRWHILSSSAGQHALIRAGQSSNLEIGRPAVAQLGWESPTYGELRPAVSLLYEVTGRLPIRFITVVLVNPNCNVDTRKKNLVLCRDSTPLFTTSLLQEQDVDSRDGAGLSR